MATQRIPKPINELRYAGEHILTAETTEDPAIDDRDKIVQTDSLVTLERGLGLGVKPFDFKVVISSMPPL